MKNKKLIQFTVFAVICTGVMFSACRKKIEREEATAPEFAEHCYNGIRDYDEIGTDCGGADCDTCVENTPPCTLTDNRLRMQHGPAIQNLTLYEKSKSTVGSHWFFRAYTDASNLEYIEFEFLSKPNPSTTYTGVSDNSFLEYDEVFIKFYGYSSADKIGSGDVYVNMTDTSYVLTSCDYSFHSWGGTATGEQYFKITFN